MISGFFAESQELREDARGQFKSLPGKFWHKCLRIYPMAIVAQRRGMLSMLSMLLFVGSSLFFIPFNCHGITLITAIPLSYMFTQYFISHRTRWLGNVLFLLFIVACVLFVW